MLASWLPFVVTTSAVIAVLILMIAFWRFVVRYLSEASNWPELARRFPAHGRPDEPAFGHQGGNLHGVAHQGILRITPSASGLFVEVARPFSSGGSSLLIPWSAFRELKEYRSLLGGRHYELVLAEEEIFFLSRPAGQAVQQYFQGRHRVIPGRTLWPLFARPLRGG